jgi:ATP-dependent RNA helicase SUPV3L1/SUV3
VRDIGARGSDALPVTVAADGEVSVGPEPIGHLTGFDFRVDPAARLADKRLLLAAAERRLGEELDRRASALVDAPDNAFTLGTDEEGAAAVLWDGHVLARLSTGRSLTEPALRTVRALDRLSAERRAALRKRLESWLESRIGHELRALVSLSRAATDKSVSAGVRAVAAMLADAGGTLPRKALVGAIGDLHQDDRRALYRLGVRLGPLDVFHHQLLKPSAQGWRAALIAVRQNLPVPELPPPGAATIAADADPRGAQLAYRRLGLQWLRIDLADRLASHARQSREQDEPQPLDLKLATSLGLEGPAIDRLMGEIGFVKSGETWKWRGRRGPRGDRRSSPSHAFAALAELKRR